MTDGFLHLTDAKDGTPVRIRLSKIDSFYEDVDKEEIYAFPGRTQGLVRTKVSDAFTMIVYGRYQHGVRETVEQVETQMADFYELAGIAAAG